MTEYTFPENAAQVLVMLQRFIRIKKYFRIDSPQNMKILAAKLRESRKEPLSGVAIEPDVFYNVGIIFSRYKNNITMGELSRELDIPMSSATRIMDWLTKNGYAERYPDSSDRRIVRVGLTRDGWKIYQALNEVILESTQRILHIFTIDEVALIHQMMVKALDAIEKESQNEGIS